MDSGMDTNIVADGLGNGMNPPETGEGMEKGAATETDRHQKFLEASLVAVRRAVSAIEKVGKCANRKSYEYSQEEVEKIFETLQQVLDEAKDGFRERKEFSW